MGFLKSSYLAEQKLGDLQVSQTSSALTNPTLGCHPKSMIRVDLGLDYTLNNWIEKIGHSKDMSSFKYISIEYGRCSSHFLQTIHVVSCWFFPCRVGRIIECLTPSVSQILSCLIPVNSLQNTHQNQWPVGVALWILHDHLVTNLLGTANGSGEVRKKRAWFWRRSNF